MSCLWQQHPLSKCNMHDAIYVAQHFFAGCCTVKLHIRSCAFHQETHTSLQSHQPGASRHLLAQQVGCSCRSQCAPCSALAPAPSLSAAAPQQQAQRLHVHGCCPKPLCCLGTLWYLLQCCCLLGSSAASAAGAAAVCWCTAGPVGQTSCVLPPSLIDAGAAGPALFCQAHEAPLACKQEQGTHTAQTGVGECGVFHKCAACH
jgi:hypothetical protein